MSDTGRELGKVVLNENGFVVHALRARPRLVVFLSIPPPPSCRVHGTDSDECYMLACGSHAARHCE